MKFDTAVRFSPMLSATAVRWQQTTNEWLNETYDLPLSHSACELLQQSVISLHTHTNRVAWSAESGLLNKRLVTACQQPPWLHIPLHLKGEKCIQLTWAFLCSLHLTVTIEESNRKKKRKAQALQIHAAHVLMKWSISIMRISLMLIISCCKSHVRKSQPGHPDIVWTPCVKTNMYRHTRVRKVVFFLMFRI